MILDQNYLYEFLWDRAHAVIYGIWKATSDCGRSFARWGLFTGIFATLFAIGYTAVDIDYGEYETALSPLYFSVVTMTTLGYGDAVHVDASSTPSLGPGGVGVRDARWRVEHFRYSNGTESRVIRNPLRRRAHGPDFASMLGDYEPPSFPMFITQALDALADPDSDMASIATIVQQDPGAGARPAAGELRRFRTSVDVTFTRPQRSSAATSSRRC